MSIKQVKNIYRVIVGLAFIFFVSVVVLNIYNLYGVFSKIYLGIFAILSFINMCEYKTILRSDVISEPSMILIATTMVACMSYMICVSFLFGRYFMSHIV